MKIVGNLAEGGALNVTNISAAALANGDSFRLFDAASYSGSFAEFVLPPLSGNLVWNTNGLRNSGVLSVVTLSAPTITSIQISGANLIVSGSGGINSWPYYLLSSTNLALPAAQWTRIATNQFDGAGNFIVTNPLDSSSAQTFYRVQLQ